MFFRKLDTGMLQSNCYVLGIAGEAVVIDPGVENGVIARILNENKLTLKYIILTHAHIDHIFYVGELQEACGGKVVIHEKDAPLLVDEVLNGSVMFGSDKMYKEADITVRDGDTLEIGNYHSLKSDGIRLEFIHTPGHTPGSMCIKATEIIPEAEVGTGGRTVGDSSTNGNGSTSGRGSTVGGSCLFTGDTLFRRGVGRTDLGAGDSRQLTQSLQRLMELEDGLAVYPGHGPHSDIGYEKKNNRYIAFAI